MPKDLDKAVRLLQAASLADNVDAEVEYAIALFNGTGTPKNQPRRSRCCARRRGRTAPIAQNRLARVLVSGQGAPMDKIEGLKWHIVAKTAGKGDPELDERLAEPQPRGPRQGRGGRAQMDRQPPANDALTAAHLQGTQSATP